VRAGRLTFHAGKLRKTAGIFGLQTGIAGKLAGKLTIFPEFSGDFSPVVSLFSDIAGLAILIRRKILRDCRLALRDCRRAF
jgi:hypothetical protein